MTRPPRRDSRRRRRREGMLRWGLRALIVLAVFGLGLALGQALHDNPGPGRTITLERTLSIPTARPGATVTP